MKMLPTNAALRATGITHRQFQAAVEHVLAVRRGRGAERKIDPDELLILALARDLYSRHTGLLLPAAFRIARRLLNFSREQKSPLVLVVDNGQTLIEVKDPPVVLALVSRSEGSALIVDVGKWTARISQESSR